MLSRHHWSVSDSCSGRAFEMATFLGPFFRPTVIPPDIREARLPGASPETYDGESYFPVTLSGEVDQSGCATVQQTRAVMTTLLHEIVLSVLR